MMLVELNAYTSLWNKYRPVILKMMSSAVNEPQQYKFFSHEFKAVGERVKGGYSFSLEVANGKAVNSIKGSAVARDLLQILQQSKTAMQLTSEATYELSLDKHLVLHVTRKQTPVEVVV